MRYLFIYLIFGLFLGCSNLQEAQSKRKSEELKAFQRKADRLLSSKNQGISDCVFEHLDKKSWAKTVVKLDMVFDAFGSLKSLDIQENAVENKSVFRACIRKLFANFSLPHLPEEQDEAKFSPTITFDVE